MNGLIKRLMDDTITLDEETALRSEIVAHLKRDSRNKAAFVCEMLREDSADMKIEMLHLIGEAQGSFFVAGVTKFIAQEEQVELLQTAATVLGRIGGVEVLHTLEDLLAHVDPNVRYGAVKGLSVIRSPESVALLMRRLDDDAQVPVWWTSPYRAETVGEAACTAINDIVGFNTKGDTEAILKWIASKRPALEQASPPKE